MIDLRDRNVRRLLAAAGWGLACWVVLAWRLGYPSFWDPDEATYAQTTREMLASGSWLVPLYDGRPFFDKPPLFYLLQMASFALLGPTELAARMVPAVSALGLVVLIVWLGRRLFDRATARVAGLMFIVLPATFALSAYAILDMTFTLFLFGGVALVTVAALDSAPRLQYAGYLLIGAAVLTKGPLALVLAGLGFLISLAIAPEARAPLWRLRWGVGLAIVVLVSAPWFLYMWLLFGPAFVEGYALNENIRLYARPLYGAQPSPLFYLKVMAVGMLPWTPLLAGRLVDAARGERLETKERLLWAWALAIVGFFTLSRFKLDHYVYPAAPALSLLCARAWVAARRAPHPPVGLALGLATIPAILVVTGAVLVYGLERVPLELPAMANLLPVVLIASGLAMAAGFAWLRRPPPLPVAAVGGLVGTYAIVLTLGLPAFEQAKPTRRLARAVASVATPDDRVAMFRLNRWSNSWRFYVDRRTENLQSEDDLRRFFALSGRHYCAMLRRDYDRLVSQGVRLRVIHQEVGLLVTTGRALRAGSAAPREQFLVVTDDLSEVEEASALLDPGT